MRGLGHAGSAVCTLTPGTIGRVRLDGSDLAVEQRAVGASEIGTQRVLDERMGEREAPSLP